MKVVVQNGAHNYLTRIEAEQVIDLLPQTLRVRVRELLLCHASGREVETQFYSRAKTLSVGTPLGRTKDKRAAARELLVALSVIAERGELPEKLSKSVRSRHAAEVQQLETAIIESLSLRAP